MLLRRLIIPLAAAATAAGLALGGATAASASISPFPLNNSSEAGYFIQGNGLNVVINQSELFLRKSAEQIGYDGSNQNGIAAVNSACQASTVSDGSGPCEFPLTDLTTTSGSYAGDSFGAMGITSCNPVWTIQEGVILNDNGTFDVVYVDGPTAAHNQCSTEGLLKAVIGGDVHILLPDVPDGHAVTFYISHNRHFTGAKIEATDVITGLQGIAENHWVHNFTEAGTGVFIDPHLMDASLTNELAAFRHTEASDSNGTLGTYGSTSAWTAYQVRAVNSGVVYVSPKSSLAGYTFKVWGGQPVV